LKKRKASRAGDWESSGNCATAGSPRFEKDIESAEHEIGVGQRNRVLKEEIGEDDIARIVAKWTGASRSPKMMEGEIQKLVQMPGPPEGPRGRPGRSHPPGFKNAILRNRPG